MTRRDVEKVLRVWVDRLQLRHWDLSIDWDTPASENADATTWRGNCYDRAVLFFDPEVLTWDALKLNRIVVHELLHLVTRDIDRVVEESCVSLPRRAYEQVDLRYEHAIEGVVDRLSYRFVELGGVV